MGSSGRELRANRTISLSLSFSAPALRRNEFHDGGALRSGCETRKRASEREGAGVSRVIVSVEMNFSFRAKVAKRFVTQSED